MARTKNVNGVDVQFTAEEEIARDAEELEWANAKPMEDWKSSMQETDDGMPRYLEDLITINSLTMTPEMKVRYDAKIKIRGEQP
jgi:uncharacterized protein with von Willebrand factor type A (vWA) domain